jgi:hypothetical protein
VSDTASGPLAGNDASKSYLESELKNSRGRGTDNITEGWVVNVAINGLRTVKLGVIEHI